MRPRRPFLANFLVAATPVIYRTHARGFVAPAYRRQVFQLRTTQKCRRDAGATTSRPLYCCASPTSFLEMFIREIFFAMHLFFVSQFWNFFLTSGAHTRKRTIASLRSIGSLLRGENGSRSACANRPC